MKEQQIAFFVAVALSITVFFFRNRFRRLKSWGFAIFFFASFLGNATILFPAPVIALVAVEGSILNPTLVALAAAAGSTLGEVTGYLLGYSGQGIVDTNSSVVSWVRDHGFLTLLVLAAIPNPFFDLAGIAAGYTGFPFDLFHFATFLGKGIKFWIAAHVLQKRI